MSISECCDVRALKARSASGWYINGDLKHEWYECSQCKQVCDIVSELIIEKDVDDEQC